MVSGTYGEPTESASMAADPLCLRGSYHEARTLASVVWRETDQRPREERPGEQEGGRNVWCATQTTLAQRRATATRHQELLADENG